MFCHSAAGKKHPSAPGIRGLESFTLHENKFQWILNPKRAYTIRNGRKGVRKLKTAVHLVIIITLITLTYLLYGKGLGAIPFLLAAIYLLTVSWKEFRRFRSRRRTQ